VSALPPASQRPRAGVSKAMRARFLDALAHGHSLAHAAKLCGKNRRRFYELRHNDREFAEQMREALEAGADWIEDELRRAAVDGWEESEETLNGEGDVVRRVTRHRRDPRLLSQLYSKRRPENSPLVEVNVADPHFVERAQPVTSEGMLEFLRESRQMHLLNSYPRAVVEPMLHLLTPAELAALSEDVVDGDAYELEEGNVGGERRNPVSSQVDRLP
jgi:hypothetical protein